MLEIARTRIPWEKLSNNFIAFILFFDNMKISYFFTPNGEVSDR